MPIEEIYEVGDEIIMLPSANRRYGVTTEGSIGEIVRRLSSNFYEVRFSYVSGAGSIGLYDISPQYFTHSVPVSLQDQIINKIKQLETRWQDKQKEKGKSCDAPAVM